MILQLLGLICLYLLAFIVLPLLLAPNHLLIKTKPIKLNSDWQKTIKKLKKIKNKEKLLKACFMFIVTRYKTKRFALPFQLPKTFWHNPNKIIKTSCYLPCNVHSFMMKTLLLAVGFKENEIRDRYSITDFVIHKYISVKINDKWINIDSWGYGSGVPFGKYASGFGYI
jgi:hypothetical protein